MKGWKISVVVFLLVLSASGAVVGCRRAADTPPVRESEVGLPVYPGLEGVGGVSGGEIEISRTRIATLPAIFGATSDPIDKVVAFYRENLPDWNRREVNGVHYFWPGSRGEDFDPESPDAAARVSINIRPPWEEGARVGVNYFFQPPD